MLLVLAALLVVLAVLVLRLRAEALGEDSARSRESATEWLSEAVDDDRDRRLVVTGSVLRWR